MTHITNEQALTRVDDFLRGITPEDKIALIHDTDPDGICSAVIMAKCIERLCGAKITIRLPLDKKKYGINENMVAQFKKAGITKLITADFSAEQDPDVLKDLEQTMSILIIDHHKLYGDYKSEKTIVYKPQYFSSIEPSRYCTAKLAYDAALRVADVTDLDWMAAAGCIADIATEPWKEWLAEVFKKYDAEMKDDLFQTKLGQVSATISSTAVYDENLITECYDHFYTATKPEDVLDSPLGKYKKIIDDELQKHLALFEEKAVHKEDLYIYELTSKYRVHSVLSTILGLKYPHRTIIIINTTHSFISVSARRGDKKFAVNDLLESAIKGFPDSNAGGHTPAAGAGFPKEHLDEFKERLWKSLTLP